MKNDKPRVGVSKKLKFSYEGVYTIIEILESRSEDETTTLYRVKPDGKGRPRVVNAAKLKKAIGPKSIERVKRGRLDASRHMDEAIQRVVQRAHEQEVPSQDTVERDQSINENDDSVNSTSVTVDNSESRTNQAPATNDSLTEQVNEILDMLEHESNDQQESEPDQEADIASDNVGFRKKRRKISYD